MTAHRTPTPIAQKKPVEAVVVASDTSRLPSSRDMMLPEPCPNIKPTACMIAMNPNTTPTAPLALVPSCPTNAVSTRL